MINAVTIIAAITAYTFLPIDTYAFLRVNRYVI